MNAESLVTACLLSLGGGALTAQGTPPPAPETVVIGSKAFPESHLLGELMTIMLAEHTRLRVEHRSGLGGTLICHEALLQGEIQIYPEYTGTALTVILKRDNAGHGALRTFLTVQRAYEQRFDVAWLQPFGMDNTYVLAMREERAAELGIRSLSDLASSGGDLRGGFSVEFLERPDGLPGLEKAYGLELLEARGMEHALAYQGLIQGTLDVVDAYATDGKLVRYGLRQLVDDREFFPPYHGAPLVRRDLLARHPEVRSTLERLAFRLSDETLRGLNYRVEEQGERFEDVARAWLTENGLLGHRSIENSSIENDGQEQRDGERIGLLTWLLARWRELLGHVLRHLWLTLIAVASAAAVAIPLGALALRYRTLRRFSLAATGVMQTVPSLALLALLITLPGFGLSARSAILALFLYALLPILRNTHTGLAEVSPALLDAARGMGLTPRQILLRVRLPLAIGTILAGVRTATVISIGTATLAAFIGAGGLGEPILAGIYLHDPRLILAGALPAALLALVADLLLANLQARLTPRGLLLERRLRKDS